MGDIGVFDEGAATGDVVEADDRDDDATEECAEVNGGMEADEVGVVVTLLFDVIGKSG